MKNYRELSSNSSEEITPLNGNDNTDGFLQTARKRRLRDPLVIVVLVQALVLLLGGIYLVSTRIHNSSCKQSPTSNKSLLYSPVQDIIQEQLKVFDDGQSKNSIYQGDGPEVDAAWADLYDMVKSIKLSREEAGQLPNKTYPAEGSPGYYLGAIDVFHQLHCLNKVRQTARGALAPGHGNPNVTTNHLDHCVESLRESIMCASDISVMVWQWDEQGQRAVPRFDYPRVCRNFEDIKAWALARKPDHQLDLDLFIVDDLPTPPILYA